jgi:hypothetical protein
MEQEIELTPFEAAHATAVASRALARAMQNASAKFDPELEQKLIRAAEKTALEIARALKKEQAENQMAASGESKARILEKLRLLK